MLHKHTRIIVKGEIAEDDSEIQQGVLAGSGRIPPSHLP